ncbi:hypothetical protein GQ457_02G028720 [Hibiscus cannabinus]
MEGTDAFIGTEVMELSLVPDLTLPPNFKVPEFKKFDGTSCPNAYLTMFCRKMTGYENDDKLLIHCFQDSLIGSAMRWYNQLSRAQRWRDVAAQVKPPLLEKETTTLFINSLESTPMYYAKHVGSTTRDFVDLMSAGEAIEHAIKSGKLNDPEASKKINSKRREIEVNIVGSGRRSYTNYQPSPQIIYPTTYSKPVADPSGQRTQSQGEPKSLKASKEKQTITPIPIPYKDLFANLLEERLISPIFLTPLQPPYPAWAFDGTKRKVVGKIDVPLLIRPTTYNVEFTVMDITPAYNCLLGRPWIHVAGAVPSMLHLKVKFVIDGRLISVGAKEDIIASTSTDAPYIDVDENAIECTFRSLEFVNATFVAERKKIPKPRLSKNTLMGVRLTVGKGARSGKSLGKSLQGMHTSLQPILKSLDINCTNDTATSSRVNFERTVCPGECKFGDGYEDYELTPDLNQRRNKRSENRTHISSSTKDRLVSLLQEFKDMFAWTYEDMPELDTSIVTRKLSLKPDCKPVLQKLRRIRPVMSLQIRDEVRKQFDARFLRVAKYPEWVANVVPIPKKNGKVRMCVDYRDLNYAIPKDNFPYHT